MNIQPKLDSSMNIQPPLKPLFRKVHNSEDMAYKNFVEELAKGHFNVKAITQDILSCRDSMERLAELNEKGRAEIAIIRQYIENLETYAHETGESIYFIEVESQRLMLTNLLKAFKEANIISLFGIEKDQKAELLKSSKKDDQKVRNRKKKVDRDGLLKMSSGVTDQLFSISRQLAATTQRSQDTLDSLVSSSSTVHGTQSELQNTGSTIQQSSTLLKKYGRREFTDKVIMFFAFLFFLAVCLYIVQKRLF